MSIYRKGLPYGVAIASLILALLLSLWLEAFIDRTIGAFFYLAIAITTWYGGLRPGLLVIALSVLALNYYFFPPIHQISFVNVDDTVRLSLFAVVALIINVLSANLRASKQKLEVLSRRQTEETQNRLQTALNAAQMGLWDWDLTTGKVTWSPEHELLFGLVPGSFDGKFATFDRCLHPDDRTGIHGALSQSLQDRVPFHYEFRVVWPDGSVHWIEGRGRAFYNEAAQPIRMSGTIMAIDQRKQAQLLLQQQFEQHHLVMEMTQRIRQSLNLQEILQTTVDEVRQFLQVDRVFILQFRKDWSGSVTVESVADPTFAILPCEIDAPCVGSAYGELFKRGLVSAKADVDTADFSPCHAKLLAQFQVRANLVVPIFKDDELWGVLSAHHCTDVRHWQPSEIDLLRQLASQLGIALQQSALFELVQRELLERQQAEAALQGQKTLLSLFAEYAPAGIAMFDREMRYMMASQRWIEEYNLGTISTLLGRSHYEIFPEIPERWRRIHQNCLAGAIERCEEDLFIRADGRQQWIAWEVRPWQRTPEEIGGIIIFSVDITQRKQAEDALRQSEARLRLAQVASNSAVWDWDVQTNTVIWSPEYYQLYQLDPTIEPSYENWLNCVLPADRDQADQQTRQALTGCNSELRVDFRVRCAGKIRWFADIGQVFRNGDEEAIRVVGITIDITQQKQNELALQVLTTELEQRVAERTIALQQTHGLLSNFFDAASSANIGLCIHDLDLNFVQINEALAAINGQTVEAHLGKTPSEILPDLAPTITPLLQKVLITGEPILNLEIAAVLPSQPGAMRYWLSSFFPILQQNGTNQTIGVGVIVIEISDRKQIEVALHQETRQKQLLWNITQTIRQSLDVEVILNTAVRETRQLLEVDRVAIYRFDQSWNGDFVAESVGEGWVKLVDPKIHKTWEDTYLQETQGGRFQNHEILAVADIYTAHLQPCHIELLEQFQARAYAIAPIFVGESLWGLFALYYNRTPYTWQPWELELLKQIASQLALALQQSELYSQLQSELQERQQSAAILRESERRWRSLLNNVQLIVIGLDQTGHINYVNPFFLTLTGYTEAEVIGRDWFTTFVPTTRQQTQQTVFSEVIHQNAHPFYQDAILTKTGEERWIAWNNTWLQDVDGTVIGTISIGEDITQRQQVEKMKDEFIGIVSHELRTPLTSIQMSLGLLQTGVYAKKPEKTQRMIEIALIDTNRLVNLVNDILDLERLESGRTTLEKTVCQASALMQQAVDGLQAIASQHAISLVVIPSDAIVWAAGDTIVQTLMNLISNAIKFSPPHSTVQLQAEPQANCVLFQVSDEGRGIPEDKLETIFGRFQQVDASDSRDMGGTGLGLPICRSIIERHGGKIWAESTPGEGSTFFFTLPIPVDLKQ